MSVADDWFRKHRINVDEYYRMSEVGLLARDARVELIQGEVFDMAPIGSRHAYVVNTLNKLLVRVIGERAIVSIQQPLRLSERSEPQPDLLLLKPRQDGYRNAHPTAADVLLLIEVSDSTLRYDREIKTPLYAQHGIPELWLFDLNGMQVHCMTQPNNDVYEVIATKHEGTCCPHLLPEICIEIDALLAP